MNENKQQVSTNSNRYGSVGTDMVGRRTHPHHYRADLLELIYFVLAILIVFSVSLEMYLTWEDIHPAPISYAQQIGGRK